MKTTLHLIPVGLGDVALSHYLPNDAQVAARNIQVYIAENAKTARAFLKQLPTDTPLQSIQIHTLQADTPVAHIREWLQSPDAQGNIGLVSEAGCPAVADPGASVVAQAHQMGIVVKPWVGPSSILLGLMASGLEGQRFAFHGYAPIAPAKRQKTLQQWEQASAKQGQTQICIETPYRNAAMFQSLLSALKPATRLCVARQLNTPQEWVKTATVAQWRQSPTPDLDKKPTLFLFLA